jgi:HAD superfamily hydrolase (TIGR01509 family)
MRTMRLDCTSGAAVLFDYNGVLLDDERLHWRACRDALAPAGIPLPEALYVARYLAFDDHAACRAALRDAGWPPARRAPSAIDRLVRRKRRLYRRLVARGGLVVSAGAKRVVRDLAAQVPLAIVSGAARFEIEGTLRRARLLDHFRVIVAAEDVRRCKPSPEGYRRALRNLRLRSGAGCVAVEDSPGGIEAARAAGIRVLAVATTYPAPALRRAGAFEVVRSLERAGPVVRILRSELRLSDS